MAQSYQIFTAAGNASSYALPDIQAQGYMNLSDLKVYLNGILATSGYSIVTSPSLALNFSVIPNNGTFIRVQRETNRNASGREVDFDNGSVLTAEDLDKSALQLLYIAQETEEGVGDTLAKGADGQWAGESLRLRNVADPIDYQDVATKNYVDGVIGLGGEGTIAVPQSWSFVGDGTTTLFPLNPEANATEPNLFIVEVGGVIQRPGSAYGLPSSSQLQITQAPAAGIVVTVRNFGVSRSVAEWDGNVTFTGNATFNAPVTMSSSLAVTGDMSVDTNVLKVDTTNNRVGINKVPTTALDVNGTVTATGVTAGTGSFSSITSANLTTVLESSLANSMLVANDTGVTVNGPLTITGAVSGSFPAATVTRFKAVRANPLTSQAGFTNLVYNSNTISSASYSTSTGLFTAPSNGIYFLQAVMTFDANGTGSNSLRFAKSGALLGHFTTLGTSAGQLEIHQLVSLTAGEQVIVQYAGIPTSSLGTSNSAFSGFLVSAS